MPRFTLFIDGVKITRDDPRIDVLECDLTECADSIEQFRKSLSSGNGTNQHPAAEEILCGPPYVPQSILFNADKCGRAISGLSAIVPPDPINVPFSDGLSRWLIHLIGAFHKNALLWRKEMARWNLY